MQRLKIHNFGPIRDSQIQLNKFMLFIGPQASGKSTIAKLIYYFLHIGNRIEVTVKLV